MSDLLGDEDWFDPIPDPPFKGFECIECRSPYGVTKPEVDSDCEICGGKIKRFDLWGNQVNHRYQVIRDDNEDCEVLFESDSLDRCYEWYQMMNYGLDTEVGIHDSQSFDIYF